VGTRLRRREAAKEDPPGVKIISLYDLAEMIKKSDGVISLPR
jgi:sulfur relay (sulfurtransferase) complex TusBCD TusD component (DsrE family)